METFSYLFILFNMILIILNSNEGKNFFLLLDNLLNLRISKTKMEEGKNSWNS